MKLSSERSLTEMKPVLLDKTVSGENTVYWVFSQLGGKWENLTVIAPGNYGDEYTKTFGHYHGTEVPEKYQVASGLGVLVLQTRNLDKILAIEMRTGDEIVITPQWGHAFVNIGTDPLMLLDDWRSGHSTYDYEQIEKMEGMAVYVVGDNVEHRLFPNPKYNLNSKPKWVSLAEFVKGI